MQLQKQVSDIIHFLQYQKEKRYIYSVLVNFFKVIDENEDKLRFSSVKEDLENCLENIKILSENRDKETSEFLIQNIIRMSMKIQNELDIKYFREGDEIIRLEKQIYEQKEQLGKKYEKVKELTNVENDYSVLFIVRRRLEEEGFMTFSHFVKEFRQFILEMEGVVLSNNSIIEIRSYLDPEIFNKIDWIGIDYFIENVWGNMKQKRRILGEEENWKQQIDHVVVEHTLKYLQNEGWNDNEDRTIDLQNVGSKGICLQVHQSNKTILQQSNECSLDNLRRMYQEDQEPLEEDMLVLRVLRSSQQSHFQLGDRIIMDRQGLINQKQKMNENVVVFGRANKNKKVNLKRLDIEFDSKDISVSRNQMMVGYNYLKNRFYLSCISSSNPTELVIGSQKQELQQSQIILMGLMETFQVRKVGLQKETNYRTNDIRKQETDRMGNTYFKQGDQYCPQGQLDEKTLAIVNVNNNYQENYTHSKKESREDDIYILKTSKNEVTNTINCQEENEYSLLELACLRGKKKDQTFLFKAEYKQGGELCGGWTEIKIGKSMDNDLIFMEDVVENYQCSLIFQPQKNKWFIQDSNSIDNTGNQKYLTRKLIKNYHQLVNKMTSNPLLLVDEMVIKVQDYFFMVQYHNPE